MDVGIRAFIRSVFALTSRVCKHLGEFPLPNPQASATDSLPVGSTLQEGRFQIGSPLVSNSFGTVYSAQATADGTKLRLQFFHPALRDDPQVARKLQQAILHYKNNTQSSVNTPLELGMDKGQPFVASPEISGSPLSVLLSKRQAKGVRFSLQQIDNIASQLCTAVVQCSQLGGHGAITLESIVIDEAGKVRLDGIGLASVAPAIAANLGGRLAPEIRQGAALSPAADVYAVGAVIYELIVGSPPTPGGKSPSQAVEGLSPLVDQFIAATTHADPGKRPKADQLQAAIHRSLSVASSDEEKENSSQVVQLPRRPSLAQSITDPSANSAPSAAPKKTHSATLQRALAETRERWLFGKGKLDYGPFSLAAIVEKIESGEIVPGDILIDNDTGTRMSVQDYPLLTEVVETAKHRRDDERRANAEVVHAKQEKTRGAALYLFVGAAIIGIAAAAFFIVKALSNDEGEEKSTIATLEEGAIEAKISFPSKEQAVKRRKKHGGNGKASGGGGVSGGWDNSLSFDMDGADVGSETLSNGQVNPVISRSGGKLGRCLRSTNTGDAFIEFMVKGTGKVYQVRVNGSTKTPIAKCIRKVMMSMKFPTFDGIRSKHNFDLSF